MDEADLKRRVKGLEAMLARDFGIHSRAELLEAMKHMQPIDISCCVVEPEPEDFLCPNVTVSQFNSA